MSSWAKVDLGYVQKVSAVGTMYKLQRRHARRLIVHSSTNGVHWNIDGQVTPYATQIQSSLCRGFCVKKEMNA